MALQVLSCPQCQKAQGSEDDSAFCSECRFPLRLVAGKYRLIKRLARGGGGTVYLAHHMRLTREKERVIKLIHQEMSEEHEMLLRFQREVEVTAILSQRNQHIVRIYDDFGHEPWLGSFYVMEYLEGMTLKQLLRQQGSLPIPLVLHIFAQLCNAMNAAHKEGVIHRDLKPPNIYLISHEGDPYYVKVIDFGIAKSEHAVNHDLTQGSMGTPKYMSPEQCMNVHTDARTDVYAMGTILYEMLGGVVPFSSPPGQPAPPGWAVMQRHINEPAMSLRQRFPTLQIPEPLDRAVLCALEKSPDMRHPSVEHFWHAIQEAVPQVQESMYTDHTPRPSTAFVHAPGSSVTPPSIPTPPFFDSSGASFSGSFLAAHPHSPESVGQSTGENALSYMADESDDTNPSGRAAQNRPLQTESDFLDENPAAMRKTTPKWIFGLIGGGVVCLLMVGWFLGGVLGLWTLQDKAAKPKRVPRRFIDRSKWTFVSNTPATSCKDGANRPCYSGSSGTRGRGPCRAGTETCKGGKWLSCSGQIIPKRELCNGRDDDCDGKIDQTFTRKGRRCRKRVDLCQMYGKWACQSNRLRCKVSRSRRSRGKKRVWLRISPSSLRVRVNIGGRSQQGRRRFCIDLKGGGRLSLKAKRFETCRFRLPFRNQTISIQLKKKSDLGDVFDYCVSK